MKKRWPMIVWGSLALAMAVVIFCFSEQSAAVSGAVSGQVTRFLLELFRPGFRELSPREQQALLEQWGLYVRKAAHFSEFFLLGLFLRLMFQSLSVRWKSAVSWAVAAVYAAGDEVHQLAVAGRAGMARDVLIDAAGALCGVLTAVFLTHLANRIKSRRRKTAGGRE